MSSLPPHHVPMPADSGWWFVAYQPDRPRPFRLPALRHECAVGHVSSRSTWLPASDAVCREGTECPKELGLGTVGRGRDQVAKEEG